MPIAYQIRQLLENHEFELALRLAVSIQQNSCRKWTKYTNVKLVFYERVTPANLGSMGVNDVIKQSVLTFIT